MSIEIIKKTISQEMYCDGILILTYKIQYPELYDPCFTAPLCKINQYYKRTAEVYQHRCRGELFSMAVQDYYESIKNGYPVHKYEAQRDYTVTLNQNCTFSLYFDQYEYTGGAHGNTVRFSDTWFVPIAKMRSLYEYFPCNKHPKEDLLTKIISRIAADPTNYFENYAELAVQNFQPKNFYLTPDTLAIYYQQYDIAPYVTGIPVFEFSYEEICAARPRCQLPS